MAREKLPYQYEMLNYIKEDLVREFGNHDKVVDIRILKKPSLHLILKVLDSTGYRRYIRIVYYKGEAKIYITETGRFFDFIRTIAILDIHDNGLFHRLQNYIRNELSVLWK